MSNYSAEYQQRHPLHMSLEAMMRPFGVSNEDINMFVNAYQQGDRNIPPIITTMLLYNRLNRLTQQELYNLILNVQQEIERNRAIDAEAISIAEEEKADAEYAEFAETIKENIPPPSDGTELEEQNILYNRSGERRFGNLLGTGLLSRDVGTLPPSTRKLLEQDKDKPIKRLTIWRKPIDANALLKTLKSVGLAKYKHDDLFHLAVNIGYDMTSNDANLEKTEYIKFYRGGIPSRATEKLDVPIPQNYVSGRPVRGQPASSAKFTTVGELFEKLRKQMGPDWTEYDLIKNNCQDFVTNILKALGVDDKKNLDFVNQNVQEVVDSLGGDFAKAIAGLAVSAKQAQNVLQEGQGCGCMTYGRPEGMCGSGYVEAESPIPLYNFSLPRCKILI